MISIIDYEQRYQSDFKRLNLEWLDSYGLTETHDLEILDDPEGMVIDAGGFIFLAMENERVIGTAGIAKEGKNTYELIKMTVETSYQGQGTGKLLLERCLAEAQKRKAEKIFLYSNSQLSAALKMYEKYGFRYIDAADSPMLTADIKMELILS